MVWLVPLRVTLYAPAVKVPPPELSQLTATLKLLEAVTVAKAAMAKLLKVNIPELAIDEPSFMVMVPEVGASVLLLFIVNAPPTEKEEVG